MSAPAPAEQEFLMAARALLEEKCPSSPLSIFSFDHTAPWRLPFGQIEYKVFRLLPLLGANLVAGPASPAAPSLGHRMYQQLYSTQPILQNPRANGVYKPRLIP